MGTVRQTNIGSEVMHGLLLVVVAMGLMGPATVATADMDSAAMRMLDRSFAAWDSPDSAGCSVGVEQDGKIIALQAYGRADLEHDVPNTPDTLFEAGSVSKQFTAAAILMLVEEGRLALSADIRTYLPEMPDYGTTITVDHLLTHTSGLRDWGFLDELAGWGRLSRISSNTDVLDIAVRQNALNYVPGSEYSYTNTGYNLLAIIVERVSGTSLPEFSRQRMFEPLGMKSTQWRHDYSKIVPGRAVGYRRYAEGPWFKWMAHEYAYGDGALLTTVEDLLRWNAALRSGALGEFVSRELVRTATLNDGTPLTYARGLQVGRRLGSDAVWHLGGMFGYRAALGRYAERNLSVAILCNAGDIEFREQELLEEVAGHFLTPPPSPPRGEGRVRLAESRAGLYVNERTHMPIRIAAAADGLRVAGGDSLQALSPTRFILGKSEGAFVGEGRLELKSGVGPVDQYRRVTEPKNIARAAIELAGEYRSEEAGAIFRIQLEGDQLLLTIDRHPAFRAVLTPAYTDSFVYDTRFGPGTAIIRMLRDDDRKVSALSVGWNLRVRDLRFHRVGAPVP